MTEQKFKSRREAIKMSKPIMGERDYTPVEIPASRKTIPSTKDLVRSYVNQALHQAGATKGYDTVDEMVKEELDLDPEDPEPPWTSAYEVTEMEEVEVPRKAAPPPEGEPPQNEEEEKPE